MYKKNVVKRVIVFLIVMILMVGCGNTNDNISNETAVKTETENMSVADKYSMIGEKDDPSFVVPEKSIEFMNAHEEFFPGNEDNDGAMSDYVNWEIGYPHLAKSISKYTDQLFVVSGYVIDVSEAEDGSLTYLHVVDYDGYSYTLYYLGALEEVFVDTEVYIYALPFAMVKFENMSAEYTEAVVGATCYVDAYLYEETY